MSYKEPSDLEVKALLSSSLLSLKPKAKTPEIALVFWHKEVKTSIVPISFIKPEDRKDGKICDVKWKYTRYRATIIKIDKGKLKYTYNRSYTSFSDNSNCRTRYSVI